MGQQRAAKRRHPPVKERGVATSSLPLYLLACHWGGIRMLRAVVLIAVFIGLLCGSALNTALRDVLAIGGIFGACVVLDWMTTKQRS